MSRDQVATDSAALGEHLRAARERRQIGVRELGRRIDVSASMISQIERGRVMPSVNTLYALVHALGVTFDEVFASADATDAEAGAVAAPGNGSEASAEGQRVGRPRQGEGLEATARMGASACRVQRKGTNPRITLGSGVEWELIAGTSTPDVEVLHVRYDIGGESTSPDALMRHEGFEYGLIEEGRLGVTVGFELHELGPGDSISFPSTMPHRLFNLLPDRATTGIWVIVGRRGDPRVGADDLQRFDRAPAGEPEEDDKPVKRARRAQARRPGRRPADGAPAKP